MQSSKSPPYVDTCWGYQEDGRGLPFLHNIYLGCCHGKLCPSSRMSVPGGTPNPNPAPCRDDGLEPVGPCPRNANPEESEGLA